MSRAPYSRTDTIQMPDTSVCTIRTFIDDGFHEVRVTRNFGGTESRIVVFQHYHDTPLVIRFMRDRWVPERSLYGLSLDHLSDEYLCSLC